MTSAAFPPGFLWGVATAGHQNEGDNVTSDTWFLEHVEPTVFREPSGKACNSYELWEDDLDLVAEMGLNAYRFSVEWARIEPSPGDGSTPRRPSSSPASSARSWTGSATRSPWQ
jgi:beta-glucosidase